MLYTNLLASTYLNAAQMSNVTIVLMYAALLVIVTSMISLRTNDPDPMLAGRNMPWWLIGASIVGTSVSSIAFLVYPSKGYIFDLNVIIGRLCGSVIALPICFFFFVAFLRKSRNASIYTLLNDRFGRWSAIYASVAFIMYSVVRMGVITCLVAQAIHLICGIDIVSVMILTGIIVVFYTYMSGIEGVIWTDFFQTIVLVIAGAASIYFLLKGIPHTGSDLWEAVRNAPMAQQKSLELSDNWGLLAITCLFFTAIETDFYAANQGVAQRYIVARSDNHAKWGLAAGGLVLPWIVIIFFGVGVLLYMFHQANPHLVDVSNANAADVFAHFIANHFPDGLKGLAIIGILAAAMSTIDTGINSSSTVLICNLYELFARASVLRQSLLTMQILRTSSAIFGALGVFCAYVVYLNGEGALDVFWKSIGVISSGVFGLFVLMRVSKKAGPRAGIIAMSVGLIVSLWMTFTAGKDYSWASPFHYMLTLPISVAATVLVGALVAIIMPEQPAASKESAALPSAKTRKQLAQQRRRAKKNIFADSLRPKPFYRLYAAIAMLVGLALYIEGPRIGLIPLDYWFIWIAVVLLGLVALLPWIIENIHNKTYTCFYLVLLGLSLPFIGAIGVFSHPNEPAFGYFYLVTLVALGTMIGWTMLGLVTMIATAAAAQLTVLIYPVAGIPDNWATLAIGALGVFTYFAMDAAKENLVTERTLGRVHGIVEKIYTKVISTSVDLVQAKRSLTFQDADQLVKASSDIKLMLSALLGATDVNPEESHMELSVRETIEHLLCRVSKKARQAVVIEGDKDFKILGNRDIFESIVNHVLDNALYYVELDQATQVICALDSHRKTLTISNNGPAIKSKDVPYIFDLGYTCDKESLGLGLAYSKKMLEGMRSGIRLISKPNARWVQFRLYFPKYAELPPQARMYAIND